VTTTLQHSHPAGWAPLEISLFVDSVLRGGEPLASVQCVRREGRRVSAVVCSQTSIQSAALNYTTDEGPWQKRTRESLTSEAGGSAVARDG